MAQYIDKAAIAAEINNWIQDARRKYTMSTIQFSLSDRIESLENLLSFLDTLEVKDMDTWHLQEKEDIYDAVKDWNLHTFACIMKDGTIQRFTGFRDEDFEGHINTHIDGVDDDICNINDIVKWIEYA